MPREPIAYEDVATIAEAMPVEPGAKALAAQYPQMATIEMAAVSLAISMKRIADAIDGDDRNTGIKDMIYEMAHNSSIGRV